MKGIVGKKLGMTSFFNEEGRQVQCTVVKTGPCYITQVKTEETDGYNAVQIAFDECKEKSINDALNGHFKKAGVSPKRKVMEFRDFDYEVNPGDVLEVDLFEAGEKIKVRAVSKGKGFQGVVKRHGFRGVGDRTHGQHNREKSTGSYRYGINTIQSIKRTKNGRTYRWQTSNYYKPKSS